MKIQFIFIKKKLTQMRMILIRIYYGWTFFLALF